MLAAGGAKSPIPIGEILAYLQVMEIPKAERPDFLRLIREMDNAYLEHRQKGRGAPEG